MLRGIDDKRRLLGFFAHKNHYNLVLRVVDVIELSNDAQDYLIELYLRIETTAENTQVDPFREGWRKRWLLQKFPDGWMVFPIEQLIIPMEMKEIEKLQAILFAYKSIRQQKGEPCRVDTCEKCNGKGCKYCGMSGMITVFIEMFPEEKRLAEQPT